MNIPIKLSGTETVEYIFSVVNSDIVRILWFIFQYFIFRLIDI